MEQVVLNKSGKRAIRLDAIVQEVRQSEEWEAVKMNILEIGIEKGREEGREETLIKSVETAMEKFHVDLQTACEGVGTTVEEYRKAKESRGRDQT